MSLNVAFLKKEKNARIESLYTSVKMKDVNLMYQCTIHQVRSRFIDYDKNIIVFLMHF